MNVDGLLGIACAFGFVACLVWACVGDVRHRRIPNTIGIVIVLLWAGMALGGNLNQAWWSGPVAGASVFAVGLVTFAFGWFGGGDVKLASAIALWAGVELLQGFLLVTALAGAVLAGLTLFARQFPIPYVTTSPLFIGPQTDGRAAYADGLPYGLAIAAGGLWILYRMLAA